MTKPLAVDLFCGLGGWAEGLLAEGYFVVGFDIEQHVYGEHRYPAQLVIQDVLTLHGSQFRHAALIVASPPCQGYSYRAMPWSRAKALPPPDNSLFEACFRIQKEASHAAGRHIPMIVENVRGAQKWVGRARWNYGSFFFWGDVPALMPPIASRSVLKRGVTHLGDGSTNFHGHTKVSGLNFSGYGTPGYKAKGFNVTAAQRLREEGIKGVPHRTKGHWTNSAEHEVAEGRKGAGAGAEWFDNNLCKLSSKSNSRKMASAMIAKIPLPISRHIGRTFFPSLESERTVA